MGVKDLSVSFVLAKLVGEVILKLIDFLKEDLWLDPLDLLDNFFVLGVFGREQKGNGWIRGSGIAMKNLEILRLLCGLRMTERNRPFQIIQKRNLFLIESFL